MAQQKAPKGYGFMQFYHHCDFYYSDFLTLNMVDVMESIGYSRAYAKQLIKSGAVKIKDTRLTEDFEHFEWYWRKVDTIEYAVENEDIFKIGTWRFIHIVAIKYSWKERLRRKLWRWNGGNPEQPSQT